MRKAIGFLIVLWGISTFFSQATLKLDSAASATLHTVEVAATVASKKLVEL